MPLPEGPVTLLVVDDEESIRNAVRKFLVQQGYEVVTAATGEDALAVIQRQKIKIFAFRRDQDRIVKLQIFRRAAPFLPVSSIGVIDQNMSHEIGRYSEKMFAILPTDAVLFDQVQIGLVN